MNKYIKTDIDNAVSQMKVAIMNALHDIDTGKETEINLGENISWNLFYNCLKEAKWEESEDWDTNGWECDFWTHYHSPSGKYCQIQGSLWCGLNYIIEVCDDK